MNRLYLKWTFIILSLCLLRPNTTTFEAPLILAHCATGGTLLAAADGFAQRMGELPVGVLTALIGGPFFCWLLMRRGAR